MIDKITPCHNTLYFNNLNNDTEMLQAADKLQFEKAAVLRDQIERLRKE